MAQVHPSLRTSGVSVSRGSCLHAYWGCGLGSASPPTDFLQKATRPQFRFRSSKEDSHLCLTHWVDSYVHQKDCYSSRDSRIPPPRLGHDQRTRSPGGATIGTLEFAQSTREILVAGANLVLVIPPNHGKSVAILDGGNSQGRPSGFGASLKGDIATMSRQKT